MNPKVLIHVVGGIAYWTADSDVDVLLVDEDNIRAGDSPVPITQDWSNLANLALGEAGSRLCKLG